MKNRLLQALFVIGIFSPLFQSCSKDKASVTTTTPETTTQKIQHKWNFISSNDYFNHGTSSIDSTHYYLGVTGDYVDFQTNGKATIYDKGVYDTVNYVILSDTKMTFDGDTFTINTLTTNSFVFTFYERINTPFFDNVVTLSR